MKAGFSVKLFIGAPINFMLRSALNQSSAWKRDKIDQKPLDETHHQGQDFIGITVSVQELPLAEIKQLENQVREKILFYCPHLKPSAFQICIFPQLFLH